MKRISTYILFFCLFSSTNLFIKFSLYAQSPSTWGQPPTGWDDFYMGLVNDYKNSDAVVNEPGYWVDLMDKVNVTSAYNVGDPIKKSIHYQYKYINAGVDTTSNWYTQTVPPYNLNVIDGMLLDGNAVGIRCAWVIYMLSEGSGIATLKSRLNDPVFMEKFYWNIKYIAKKCNGNKSIFIIEPDTWGELIQAKYLGDASIGTTLPGQAGSIAISNPAQYGYLAGLPNTLPGVCQAIVRTIRTYAPDAFIGFHANTWSAWTSDGIAPCTGCSANQTGMVWWSVPEIDLAVNYQVNFYNSMFNGPDFDKGDILVTEKYGANPALGAGGAAEWTWGTPQMQNWLYFSQKMGQGFCKPLMMWQIQLGQSNAASAAAGVSNLPNTTGRYTDTFVEYMFNNFGSFQSAGFIGFMGGKGLPGMTEYSNQNTYGDNGYYFWGLRNKINPLRPIGLVQGVPVPHLGVDTTLCGTGGSLVLNPGNMGGNPMLWSTGATTTTITINTAGTYWVKIGGAGTCQKTDTIVVSNTYSVNLGSDMNFCTPTAVTLDAGHSGIGVTYVWKFNGAAITGASSRTLAVNQAGTYDVIITDPSCLPAKTDQIIITTTTITPNTPACFNAPGTANLSVVNAGGNYKWYTQATGGLPVHTGATYTTPTISTATTYYLEDSTLISSTIINKIASNGFTNYNTNANPASPTDWLNFNALEGFKLISFTIDAIINFCPGTRRGRVIIQNTSTGFSYDSGDINMACLGTGTQIALNVVLPLGGINIPAGNGYKIRYYSPGTEANMGYYSGTPPTMVYPKNHSNIIQTTSYSSTGYSGIMGHPAMYNWKISSISTCARVPITATPCPIAAPVELLNFSGYRQAEKVLLIWNTATENNNDYFIIERSSDGTNFSAVGKLKGKGTSKTLSAYSFYDEHPGAGGNYYRLLQVDYNGAAMCSQVIYVPFTNVYVSVYPNPFENTTEVKIDNPGENTLNIKIYDGMGVLLMNKETSDPQSSLTIGNEFSAGLYILQVNGSSSIDNYKLIKE